jgi:hypothetical protein
VISEKSDAGTRRSAGFAYDGQNFPSSSSQNKGFDFDLKSQSHGAQSFGAGTPQYNQQVKGVYPQKFGSNVGFDGEIMDFLPLEEEPIPQQEENPIHTRIKEKVAAIQERKRAQTLESSKVSLTDRSLPEIIEEEPEPQIQESTLSEAKALLNKFKDRSPATVHKKRDQNKYDVMS